MKISFNFFIESEGLHVKLQSIKGRLNTIQSTQEVSKLTRELEQTSTALIGMKDKARNVFGQSQQDYLLDLEDQVVQLFGYLENARISRKVFQIQGEAESLKNSMAGGGQVKIKVVNSLKRHIFCFLRNHRPGIEDRRVINDARLTLKRAESTLKTPSPVDEKPIVHFKWLAHKRDVRLIENIELEPGQYEDLFDVALRIYNGKLQEAKATYNQLPENLKRTFRQHIGELKAVAFEDETETIQALLATANELLSNQEPYPTRSQIDEIFMELHNVTAEEEKNPVRFSLRLPS